jgi:hypothetical protein
MGANPTQALAICVFFLASAAMTIGMATGGSLLLIVIGLGLLAASAALFRRAKSWEERQG